jgi:hypothetical protein
MQISRRILLACVTAVALLPLTLPAEDTEAQAKARRALEQQLNNPSGQPAVQTNIPAANQPARPQAAPATPKAKAPAPTAPPPAVRPAPAPAAAKPAQPVPPVAAPKPTQPVPAAAGQEAGWDVALPAGSSTDVLEKARNALHQKISDLNGQPPQGAAGFQPVPETAPATPNAGTAVTGTPSQVTRTGTGSASQTRAPATARDAAISTAVMDAKARQQQEAKMRNEEAAGKPSEPAVEAPGVLAPLFPPPMPISGSKEQRLRELLYRYTNDQINPEQYHQQRAKILAEP